MEMCYDGALVMPNNYTVVDAEEMTYVEGGYTYLDLGDYYTMYLTPWECSQIADGIGLGATMEWIAAACLSGCAPAAVTLAVVAGAMNVGQWYMNRCAAHKGAMYTGAKKFPNAVPIILM